MEEETAVESMPALVTSNHARTQAESVEGGLKSDTRTTFSIISKVGLASLYCLSILARTEYPGYCHHLRNCCHSISTCNSCCGPFARRQHAQHSSTGHYYNRSSVIDL
jgi:hypothetical protein